MRQPPSPLLLSARKRRPRRNPPRGAQQLAQDASQPPDADAQAAAGSEGCALLQRDGFDPNRRPTGNGDDEPSTSSR